MERPPISSLTNERVKAAVRLRDRRERDAVGLTIVDGARELRRALESGASVATVFVSADHDRDDDARWVVQRVGGVTSTIAVPVTRAVLARIAFGDRNDGVVGLVRPPSIALDDLVLGDEPLIVVAEGVEKPGNLGAILRTADGAGADAVIVADPATDPFNPNVIRASIGAVFTVPVAVAEPSEVLAWLRHRSVRVITARVDAVRLHTDEDLTGGIAIVVGSEADGLSAAWVGPDTIPIRLPMLGRTDSLNVSVATAVLLYEARRQRDRRAAGTA